MMSQLTSIACDVLTVVSRKCPMNYFNEQVYRINNRILNGIVMGYQHMNDTLFVACYVSPLTIRDSQQPPEK